MQKFDLEVKYRCSVENIIADHLYELSIGFSTYVLYFFLNDQILEIKSKSLSWYTHVVNYLVVGLALDEWNHND